MGQGWQDRIEYGFLRALEAGLGGLSARKADRAGAMLGGLIRRPLGIRRDVVVANLRRAFPEASEAWIEETTISAYRHLGREVTAMLRLSSLDPEAVRDLTVISDRCWTAVEDAFSEGRGVIFATGHYGNWEMAAAAVSARGHPITAIVKGMRNQLVDRRISDARRALGVETTGLGEAPRRVPRALAAGHAVGIVADQDARRSGVFVPFFGIPASTHRGPALFALRTGAPLMASIARRLPDGRYLVDARRIDASRTDDFEADILRVTGELASALEREIRIDPTQYFWFHKRWKTSPFEEPPSRLTGITST
ncbi:MAG: lysophospholipid acyltransferase family protein [Gemmatimonadota bacterium]|jgi:KDO2-lipid IV(A) lauroyltransferase|nr:lysophospholipid acyltransferase family protein [Gemmatimonadota bacterium]